MACNWLLRNYIRLVSGMALLVLLGAVAACHPAAPATTQEIEAPITATLLPTESPTPEPSATSLPALVLFYTPEGADPRVAQILEQEISALAARDGLRFESKTGLSESDLELEPRLVVALSPDEGIVPLSQSYPSVQFLAVDNPNLETTGNLSILRAGGDAPDQQGFLAGYMAAVLTTDWRVGVISSSDTISGRAARNGFTNGVIFYCGLCRPVYPPFYTYPLYYDLPSGASAEEQTAAADFLLGQAVETVYIAPGAGSDTLTGYLAQAGVNLIGSEPPPTDARDNWIASIQTDLAGAFGEMWSRLINGEGGLAVNLPLTIQDQNEALFSPGRQHHVNKIMQDLVSGYIDTGIDPATGEPR